MENIQDQNQMQQENTQPQSDTSDAKGGLVVESATIERKLASFLIDSFLVSMFFEIIISILLAQLHSPDIQKIYSALGNGSMLSSSTTATQIETEILFGYILVFALYNIITLFVFNKTVGMAIMRISYATADANGNPRPLSIPQKFLRGFIGAFLTYLFIFIPSISWPFDQYKRSINDRLSSVYVIQTSTNPLFNRVAWIFTAICIALAVVLLFVK